jgi:flavin-dependent dehydrogenase
MPRTRRRRANDRRREADQRRIAAEALTHAKQVEKENLERYVKAVYQNHAGEVVRSRNGRAYQVQDDGSLRPFHEEKAS